MFVSEHERISRVSLVCAPLCVACTHVHKFTDDKHGLTCVLRRRLDQSSFGIAFTPKHVSHTCQTSSLSTHACSHSGSGAGDISLAYSAEPAENQKSLRRTLQYLPNLSITGMSTWSPRQSGCTFRSGTAIQVVGEITSKKSTFSNRREPRSQLVSCSATGWWLEGSSAASRSGDDGSGAAHSAEHP